MEGLCAQCQLMKFAPTFRYCPDCGRETNMAFRWCEECAVKTNRCAHCARELTSPVSIPTIVAAEKYKSDKLSWDEYFTLIALMASSRGSCDRLRTACVIVKNNRIVASGYNGSVSGTPSCDEVGHLIIKGHCKRALHGERNSIDNAVADLTGSTAYIIATPCPDCIKELLQNGVQRIVYVGRYDNTESEYKAYADEICALKHVKVDNIAPTPLDVLKILAKAIHRLRGPGGLFKDLTDDDFKFLINPLL